MVLGEFPSDVRSTFISGLLDNSELCYIWKHSKKHEVFTTLPKNILVEEWVPQNDLLAHPKVVLFITHGGNNGQYEALYHGKGQTYTV